ncbi:TAXI family TRAP transporter solute-binding subunit [Paenibacillus sp. IB182496]|uniref:TAXI family TRAP transporter solute-binding subunit n=1 Tax=Paenibacillus sabuli TaxID=2772509 RepID=A0A927GQE7_9BACL|nr:TAXI family TRAP transporter solute-binding subunit [Paenibacillus sabuli]MBD2843810.1 TAXI family TRAP transporter solute-binding subunit [Paenibacillus sabuli]
MRRYTWVLLLAMMLVGVTACGNAEENEGTGNDTEAAGGGQSTVANEADAEGEEEPQTQAEPLQLRSISGNVGGNVHVITGALGSMIEENLAGSVVNVNPGESGANPILLGKGEAEIGTTLYFNAATSAKGIAPYEEPVNHVAALANLNINQWITFITSKAEYETLGDMIDAQYPMKLVLARAGSTSETLIRLILEGYGVTYDDIKAWGGSVTHVSHTDAVDLVKDNHADVYATIPSLRFPAVVDLVTSREVVFLQLDPAVVDAIAEEYGLLTGNLPAGTYDGQDEDYYSLMETQLLLANADALSEQGAYEVVKLLVENVDRLRDAHSDMDTFSPEAAPQNTVFPLHPGAEKYYREIGVLD